MGNDIGYYFSRCPSEDFSQSKEYEAYGFCINVQISNILLTPLITEVDK